MIKIFWEISQENNNLIEKMLPDHGYLKLTKTYKIKRDT